MIHATLHLYLLALEVEEGGGFAAHQLLILVEVGYGIAILLLVGTHQGTLVEVGRSFHGERTTETVDGAVHQRHRFFVVAHHLLRLGSTVETHFGSHFRTVHLVVTLESLVVLLQAIVKVALQLDVHRHGVQRNRLLNSGQCLLVVPILIGEVARSYRLINLTDAVERILFLVGHVLCLLNISFRQYVVLIIFIVVDVERSTTEVALIAARELAQEVVQALQILLGRLCRGVHVEVNQCLILLCGESFTNTDTLQRVVLARESVDGETFHIRDADDVALLVGLGTPGLQQSDHLPVGIGHGAAHHLVGGAHIQRVVVATANLAHLLHGSALQGSLLLRGIGQQVERGTFGGRTLSLSQCGILLVRLYLELHHIISVVRSQNGDNRVLFPVGIHNHSALGAFKKRVVGDAGSLFINEETVTRVLNLVLLIVSDNREDRLFRFIDPCGLGHAQGVHQNTHQQKKMFHTYWVVHFML